MLQLKYFFLTPAKICIALSYKRSVKGSNEDSDITGTITSPVSNLSLSYTDTYLTAEFSQIGLIHLILLSIQEKCTYIKLCTGMCYNGTISILTIKVIADLRK